MDSDRNLRSVASLACRLGQIIPQLTSSVIHIKERSGNQTVGVEHMARSVGAASKELSAAPSAAAVEQAFDGLSKTLSTLRQESYELDDETLLLAQHAESVRSVCNQLIFTVGTFRFDIHKEAEATLGSIADQVMATGTDASVVEAVLERSIDAHPGVELLYYVGADGVQGVRNISPRHHDPDDGAGAIGADWSLRPWFQGALACNGCFTSDVYVSVATDAFCFTVAKALHDPDGGSYGVLAADFNLGEFVK